MTVPQAASTGGPVIRRRPSATQQRVLDAIIELGEELGHAPSLREIAARTGTSVSTVHHHVRRLVAAGWVRRRADQPRTLVPVVTLGGDAASTIAELRL